MKFYQCLRITLIKKDRHQRKIKDIGKEGGHQRRNKYLSIEEWNDPDGKLQRQSQGNGQSLIHMVSYLVMDPQSGYPVGNGEAEL